MSPAGDLERDGLAVIDHYLAPEAVRSLAGRAQERRRCGEFREARIGQAGALRDAQIRGDSTCWIEAPLAPEECQLLAGFEQLRRTLNRELQLGLFELELHYARYGPGAGYQRHVDQPHARLQRRVSLVLYLNEDWTAQAGGQLRLHARQGVVEVLPLAGRLVCFLSAGLEHEVLTARRERLSVTGWLLARP